MTSKIFVKHLPTVQQKPHPNGLSESFPIYLEVRDAEPEAIPVRITTNEFDRIMYLPPRIAYQFAQALRKSVWEYLNYNEEAIE